MIDSPAYLSAGTSPEPGGDERPHTARILGPASAVLPPVRPATPTIGSLRPELDHPRSVMDDLAGSTGTREASGKG